MLTPIAVADSDFIVRRGRGRGWGLLLELVGGEGSGGWDGERSENARDCY